MTDLQTPAGHHPDRLMPSSADGVIQTETGLDLPALLDSTHPLAKPLRLTRIELAMVDRELKEMTERLARCTAIRLDDLKDGPSVMFPPAGEPTARDLDTVRGVQAGLHKALSSILCFWTTTTTPSPS